jgi:predicted methyltransferase
MRKNAGTPGCMLIAALLFAAFVPGPALGQAALQPAEVRDPWQRPEEVMDALEAGPGSVIADIGAGFGYFTFHLAERVGPTGRVHAIDVRNGRLEAIRERVAREGLTQVQVRLGAVDDPLLDPESVDAVLVSNAYHDLTDFDAMLEGMFRGLKPGGSLVIIDEDAPGGLPRTTYHNEHHIAKDLVIEDATRNGFTLVREPEGFNPTGRRTAPWFFLIFRRP